MKIAFFELFSEIYNGEKEVLEKFFTSDEVSYFNEKLSPESIALAKDAEIISVFTSSIVNKEMINLLPNLRFINTSSTGFEHIDLEYCRQKGIQVSNVPAYGSNTVAEFTFALLLALSRKIIKANNQLRVEDDFNIRNLYGFDLFGKTMGVIGTGKIGRNSIRIARGFGMEVLACDSHPDAEFAQKNGFEYKSIDEVLATSDVITLHAPYTKENHHLINKERIAKMKKGAYLINTARGALVDTDALVWGLREGILAGAGLDVLEEERDLQDETKTLANPSGDAVEKFKILLEDHALIDMPNVIVTPHIAFYSKEAVQNIINTTVENIKAFISGKPINLV